MLGRRISALFLEFTDYKPPTPSPQGTLSPVYTGFTLNRGVRNRLILNVPSAIEMSPGISGLRGRGGLVYELRGFYYLINLLSISCRILHSSAVWDEYEQSFEADNLIRHFDKICVSDSKLRVNIPPKGTPMHRDGDRAKLPRNEDSAT